AMLLPGERSPLPPLLREFLPLPLPAVARAASAASFWGGSRANPHVPFAKGAKAGSFSRFPIPDSRFPIPGPSKARGFRRSLYVIAARPVAGWWDVSGEAARSLRQPLV